MITIVCENSTYGFLSAVFYAYEQHAEVDMVMTSPFFQASMLSEVVQVPTSKVHAERVRASFVKKFGYELYHDVCLALRAGNPYQATVTFKFVKLLFDKGAYVSEMANLGETVAFYDLVNAVSYETHRIKGFLRFAETTSGIYYAAYTPDNDITELIMPHFCERFSDMNFIIHDKTRNIIGLNGNGKTRIEHVERGIAVEFTDLEMYYQKLFKTYYDSVNIKERKNKRLQDGWLPVRYRKNMNEFK